MRCFVAVELSREVRGRLDELQKKLPAENLKLVEPENMHVTLKFLGEIDERKAREVEQRLEGVKAAPFALKVKGAGAFPNERYARVVWAGCGSAELDALARKVNEALAGMNFEEERFSGHITLARVRGPVELAEFFGQNRDAELGELAVDAFELKKSILGRGGPAYSVIRKFALKP